MEVKICGKETGVGAYDEGRVIGYKPDHVDQSRTGRHWEYTFKVPDDAIVIHYGHDRNGNRYRFCVLANGKDVPPERMHEITEAFPEWESWKSVKEER